MRYAVAMMLFILLNTSCEDKGKYNDITRLSGDMTIDYPYWTDSDELLVIEPGTHITLGKRAGFHIQGDFQANGTAEEPIIIQGSSDTITHTVFRTYETDELIFNHTTIHNGLIVSTCEKNEFHNVTITNDKELIWDDAAIRVWGGSFVADRCTLESNNTGEGFLIFNVDRPSTTNCSFYQVPDAVEYVECPDGLISDCKFRGMKDDAVDNNACLRTIITNNEFYDVMDRAMELGNDGFGSSFELQIDNNLFVRCLRGVCVKEGSSAFVSNSTFYNCETNIELTDNWDALIPNVATVTSSVMLADDTPFEFKPVSDLSVNNTLSNITLEGENNVKANITFADPENENFEFTSDAYPVNFNADNIGYHKK